MYHCVLEAPVKCGWPWLWYFHWSADPRCDFFVCAMTFDEISPIYQIHTSYVSWAETPFEHVTDKSNPPPPPAVLHMHLVHSVTLEYINPFSSNSHYKFIMVGERTILCLKDHDLQGLLILLPMSTPLILVCTVTCESINKYCFTVLPVRFCSALQCSCYTWNVYRVSCLPAFTENISLFKIHVFLSLVCMTSL